MDYIVQLTIFVLIWGMLAASLNLYVGYTGVISVAHAALFGVGAYASSAISIRVGGPFVISIAAAVLIGAAFGALLATPLLRIKGDAQVIVSLAFQGLLFSLFNNIEVVTGGPSGLAGIPRVTALGSSADLITLIVVATAFSISITALHRVVTSPVGRILVAIREDEKLALSLGKNVMRRKLEVSAIAGAIAGAAGSLYAQYVGFIDPTQFDLNESFSILCIVIIGGAGSFYGPLVGAAFIVLLPQLLLFVGLTTAHAANWRQVIFGMAITGLMIFRPQGVLGNYEFRGRGS